MTFVFWETLNWFVRSVERSDRAECRQRTFVNNQIQSPEICRPGKYFCYFRLSARLFKTRRRARNSSRAAACDVQAWHLAVPGPASAAVREGANFAWVWNPADLAEICSRRRPVLVPAAARWPQKAVQQKVLGWYVYLAPAAAAQAAVRLVNWRHAGRTAAATHPQNICSCPS